MEQLGNILWSVIQIQYLKIFKSTFKHINLFDEN